MSSISPPVSDAPPAWRVARRRRIVRAAAELLRRSAAEAVQIEDIVRRAGVGRATFYRYFASKDEVLAACFDEALDALDARLKGVADSAMSPPDELRHMIEGLVEVQAEHFAPLRLLARSRAELSRRWREALGEMRVRVLALLRANLLRGIETGHYREDADAEATPALLIGMVRAGLMHLPDLPRTRLVGAISALVLAGVITPPPPCAGPAARAAALNGGERP
ncbi:MAG TPA: TetR/AcrR family transcriptional regulator [Geminicoccaceae bacterium]|nr:TetR/AcrR family transcriptional regulator [Geminicoccaceae bacterium]